MCTAAFGAPVFRVDVPFRFGHFLGIEFIRDKGQLQFSSVGYLYRDTIIFRHGGHVYFREADRVQTLGEIGKRVLITIQSVFERSIGRLRNKNVFWLDNFFQGACPRGTRKLFPGV